MGGEKSEYISTSLVGCVRKSEEQKRLQNKKEAREQLALWKEQLALRKRGKITKLAKTKEAQCETRGITSVETI